MEEFRGKLVALSEAYEVATRRVDDEFEDGDTNIRARTTIKATLEEVDYLLLVEVRE